MTSFSKKIVSRMPLDYLWTDAGKLEALRQRYLNRAELQELMEEHKAIRFAIASIGSKLVWIDEADGYHFWKSEAEAHVPEEEEFDLDEFHGHYAYVPSLWSDDTGKLLILLETFH